MRSLIQLAGRIQRHRKIPPKTANLLILSKNIRALEGDNIAYTKPGFESCKRIFTSHDLVELLKPEHYQRINAIPRIIMPKGKLKKKNGQFCDFVELEHWALCQRLLGAGKELNNAQQWWQTQSTWCAELQRQQPFRCGRSSADTPYCLYSEEDDDPLYWAIKDETGKVVTYPATEKIKKKEIEITTGNQAWLLLDTDSLYLDLAHNFDRNKKYISKVFGELRLRESEDYWLYHPILGMYCDKD